MALLEWRDDFSLGIAEIDYEHRQMLELINKSYAQLTGDAPASTVIDCLGEIFARISAHFALEEKLMRERRYDEYEDHKADHERLLDEIRDIMDDFEQHRSFDENEFAGKLEQWFSEHFKNKDARLHHYLG